MKHLRTIGTAVFAALATLAGSAAAQTPSAGPPPPPAAAMPAKPAPAPAPAPAVAKPATAAAPAPTAAKPAAAPAAAKPAVAAAPPGPPPAAPKPAAELDQLKSLEGSWRCDGKQPAGPFGPEQAYKSSFKMKKDIENFWIGFEYAQKKSKVHTLPVTAKGYLGYDPATKKYVTMGVDNMGGSITESSTGWEGDKLVFAGDGQMGGQKVSFRETYLKKGDKEMTWTGEVKMGKEWIPVGTDSCKK